jgi:glycosyltransferase involved in cell wall biosynthesis
MPFAVERFDLSGYDLIISNCHAVSKGILTSTDQFHVSYIHTPIRYAWDMEEDYLDLHNLRGMRGLTARALLYYIRTWDRGAARRPDQLLASSLFSAGRITKAYQRSSKVIYPPVNTGFYKPGQQKDDFYLTASRLVPYKRMDLIVKAFLQMPDKKLIVIGDGPEAGKIQKLCGGNVTWLGYQTDEVLRDYLQRARAFLFAAREDFGILPVEAQACGTPVIAFGEGGATETVLGQESETPTGVLFYAQTTEAICGAVREFERHMDSFSSENCRRNAERFSIDRFRREFREFILNAWERFTAHYLIQRMA